MLKHPYFYKKDIEAALLKTPVILVYVNYVMLCYSPYVNNNTKNVCPKTPIYLNFSSLISEGYFVQDMIRKSFDYV